MNMKTDIKVIVIFSVLLLSSCRSTDQENTLSENGITAVKINLLGTEYTNTNIPVPVASSDKKGSLTNEKVQRQSTLITPSKVLIGELIPVPSAVEPLASVSKAINSTRSISGDKLRSGLKFRVIAYNKDGSYFTHEDYTIGRHATPLMLNGGEDYDIIIYSFSTDKLPDITKSEMLNIDNAAVYYDDGNEDFMYQRISYTPNGSNTNNTLDFTLRHRLSQITVVLKSSFGDISAIQKTYLEPHYHGGEILLSNARIKSEYAGAKNLHFLDLFPVLNKYQILYLLIVMI